LNKLTDMTSKPLKSVSYIMPVLNEEKHLAAAVRSIFEQEQTGPTEVILALGPSTDNTNKVAAELAKEFAVVLVENPTGKTPAGLNAAIKAAKHDVVVRVDAHSVLSPGYTKLAVEILNTASAEHSYKGGAIANVGGVMRAVGTTPLQKAVAYAYTSRVGLGGGTFHVGGKAGPSDSVYLGVFRRDLLLEVGMFDERMIRGQDWQLNLRIREAGYTVWFDPRLEVTYYPRSSVSRLAKQFYDTGIWRALITKMAPTKANLRYFIPPLLVLATLFGFPFGVYIFAVAVVAFSAEGLDTKTRLNLLIALPVMHYCWGAGFIRGLFAKPIKNESRG
jgi:glycosyltransferase involved in cell wall biosynthesis